MSEAISLVINGFEIEVRAKNLRNGKTWNDEDTIHILTKTRTMAIEAAAGLKRYGLTEEAKKKEYIATMVSYAIKLAEEDSEEAK